MSPNLQVLFYIVSSQTDQSLGTQLPGCCIPSSQIHVLHRGLRNCHNVCFLSLCLPGKAVRFSLEPGTRQAGGAAGRWSAGDGTVQAEGSQAQTRASGADCPQAMLILFLGQSQLGHSARWLGRRTLHMQQPLSVWGQDPGATREISYQIRHRKFTHCSTDLINDFFLVKEKNPQNPDAYLYMTLYVQEEISNHLQELRNP